MSKEPKLPESGHSPYHMAPCRSRQISVRSLIRGGCKNDPIWLLPISLMSRFDMRIFFRKFFWNHYFDHLALYAFATRIYNLIPGIQIDTKIQWKCKRFAKVWKHGKGVRKMSGIVPASYRDSLLIEQIGNCVIPGYSKRVIIEEDQHNQQQQNNF